MYLLNIFPLPSMDHALPGWELLIYKLYLFNTICKSTASRRTGQQAKRKCHHPASSSANRIQILIWECITIPSTSLTQCCGAFYCKMQWEYIWAAVVQECSSPQLSQGLLRAAIKCRFHQHSSRWINKSQLHTIKWHQVEVGPLNEWEMLLSLWDPL